MSDSPMFRMRRANGTRDTHVFFPNGSVSRPDVDGAVSVLGENVLAMMKAGYEIVNQDDLACWYRQNWHRSNTAINQQET